MQPFRVMKFGGTSVAGAGRMRGVAELVAEAARSERIGVVASAVSGVTDLLVRGLADAASGRRAEAEAAVTRFRALHRGIARELGETFDSSRCAILETKLEALAAELAEILQGVALLGDCSPRVEARAIVLGERASCALLFELLASRELDIEALDPLTLVPCIGDPLLATPQPEKMRLRLQSRREGGKRVLLLPGFFGGDENGQVMCLGRGGSDYSAALLAQALEARLLEIWTDVDGVFTTDPRLAPAATCLESMSYEEAMELAHFGAKVLHPRTIAPARAAAIPVRIRNSFRPEHPGTLVERRTSPAAKAACGISFTRGVALVSVFGPGMEGVPGVAARLFAALARSGISVILITQGSSETAISFCVEERFAGEAESAVRSAFESEIDTGRVDAVEAKRGLAIVSLVGDGMRERIGVAGRFFSALGDAEVNVAAIAQGASERSISAVLAEDDGARAVAAVHGRLFEQERTEGVSPRREAPAPATSEVTAPAQSEHGWVAAFAPAGIGNFAAGFDLLGAAIAPVDGTAWGDRVQVRRAAGRLPGDDRLECRGAYASRLPADPHANLVLKARAAFASRLSRRYTPLPALDFVLFKELPVASGLGSSASSVAATLVALNELFDRALDPQALLAAAGEAEAQASGAVHLDNVAPALLGGLRLVDPDSGSRALPFPDGLRFVLFVPELTLETRLARSVLPRELSVPHAIAWAQNLGALIHALHTDDRKLLRRVLRDSLAEPHRAALVPGFRAVQQAALAAGALGCTLSGAGPAVFAVVEPETAEAIAAAGVAAWRAAGVAVESRLCFLDLLGARRVEPVED